MEPIRAHHISRGFTLIELLVVLAIITVISAIVLSSQSNFNKSLLLANTAYDIALTFRYAETFGIASRVSGVAANTGYGLHFSTGTSGSFILFADTYPNIGTGSACHPAPTYDPTGPSAVPGDCAYEPGSDVTSQVYTLGNGATIANFCAESYGSWQCSAPSNTACPSSGGNGLTSLDIVFARPNPIPYMSTNGAFSNNITNACIALTSLQGGCKYIAINSAGEINANATSCP